MTRLPRLLLPVTACLAVAVPVQSAAAAKLSYPSITKVSPLQLGVGDTLTVRGKGFRAGKGRNTVVFQRTGGRAVFVKADKATKTTISVMIPPKILSALGQNAGKPVATRFRVRVLAGRLGRHFTTDKNSPVIGPAAAGTSPAGSPAAGAGQTNLSDCDGDLVPDTKDADDDNDLLADDLEARLRTDPCKPDTDGDAITDGYEYQSAFDLNSTADPDPFPRKRAYANPLDAEDANQDFDGDGLTLSEEYRAWRFSGSPTPLSYSDGSLYTGGRGAAVAADDPRDTDGSGYISDDERDVDADGLMNWDEAHGRMTPKWWALSFTDPIESVYPGRIFEATSFPTAPTTRTTTASRTPSRSHGRGTGGRPTSRRRIPGRIRGRA